MADRSAAVLQHIDAVLREAENIRQVVVSVQQDDDWPREARTESSDEDIARANMLILSTVKKYSAPGSPYMEQAQAVVTKNGLGNEWTRQQLLGMLRALRFEYASGAMATVEELVHADMFSDFLLMARHQLDKGFKDPAAVLAGGVLEQHLRTLANRSGVTLVKDNGEAKRSEAINEELTKAGAYPMATQKEVTAKLELRNSAAHGEWSKYDEKQVAMFIDWVAFFAQKHPA